MTAFLPLPITAAAAVPLALLFVMLSLRVIRLRHRLRAAFGDAGDADLARQVRVHANFAEHVPFALLLLALAELRGSATPGLAIAAAALVIGRVAHAVGVSSARRDGMLRVIGVGATQTSILVSTALLAASFA